MAIQTQRNNGRIAGMWRVLTIAAGTLTIGAAVVTGGISGSRAPAAGSPVESPAVMRNYAPGVDVPANVDLRMLPPGYRDYIRSDILEVPAAEPEPASSIPAAQPVMFGIDLPIGATLADLPPGITNYIRRTWPALLPPVAATNPAYGIDLPAGARPEDLPAGVTDYLRDRTGVRTPGSQAVPMAITNPELGVDAPANVPLRLLPPGYRDYIRSGR